MLDLDIDKVLSEAKELAKREDFRPLQLESSEGLLLGRQYCLPAAIRSSVKEETQRDPGAEVVCVDLGTPAQVTLADPLTALTSDCMWTVSDEVFPAFATQGQQYARDSLRVFRLDVNKIIKQARELAKYSEKYDEDTLELAKKKTRPRASAKPKKTQSASEIAAMLGL